MTCSSSSSHPTGWPKVTSWVVVLASALVGLSLIVDQAGQLSATYDEVTYLKVAAHWWRTGEQSTITRMGSPLSFWKIQQGPTLWAIDRWGDSAWIDDPIAHQARLLPWVRIGGAWVWLAGLVLVASWARSWYGDHAMALAAALYALSPNLLAHGALATMEGPITVTSAAMVWAWHAFLQTRNRWAFVLTASLGGLAFSCKFTACLIPPILALIWAADCWIGRDRDLPLMTKARRIAGRVTVGMVGFLAIMALANLIVTGFATLPLSPRSGPHPWLIDHLPPWLANRAAWLLEQSYPQDWVGFATQLIFQGQGGPSYLLGERRSSGWWYYYPVSLAVKVPLACWFLILARCRVGMADSTESTRRGWIIPVYVGLFLLAAMVGSKRNYGVRYLLPLAPLVIVSLSKLANLPRKWRLVWQAGLVGMMATVAAIHPAELSYFNLAVGGPVGGRHVLADSNLDWGQGAISLQRLQTSHPEFRDLTWYYFGDTDPGHYGVVGPRYAFDAHHPPLGLPPEVAADTKYLAVSASLQWGPWGPEKYFHILNQVIPVRYTSDKTVAIYRTADLNQAHATRTH